MKKIKQHTINAYFPTDVASPLSFSYKGVSYYRSNVIFTYPYALLEPIMHTTILP